MILQVSPEVHQVATLPVTREDPVAAREDWMKIRWVKISLII